MQPMMHQQNGRRRVRCALVADKLAGVSQFAGFSVLEQHQQFATPYHIPCGIEMRAFLERSRLVKHVARPFHHFGATLRVVATAFFQPLLFGNHVGAIQGVVQAAPARIGRIEGITGIEDWNHQLGPRLHRQFVIDTGGGDLHLGRLRHQITGFFKKQTVGGVILNRSGVGRVPFVQFCLQAVAFGQQGGIFGRQVIYKTAKVLPEILGADAKIRQNLVIDKVIQHRCDLQLPNYRTFSHDQTLSFNQQNRDPHRHQRLAQCKVSTVFVYCP